MVLSCGWLLQLCQLQLWLLELLELGLLVFGTWVIHGAFEQLGAASHRNVVGQEQWQPLQESGFWHLCSINFLEHGLAKSTWVLWVNLEAGHTIWNMDCAAGQHLAEMVGQLIDGAVWWHPGVFQQFHSCFLGAFFGIGAAQASEPGNHCATPWNMVVSSSLAQSLGVK